LERNTGNIRHAPGFNPVPQQRAACHKAKSQFPAGQVLVCSIKAAATPSGWLYKPETHWQEDLLFVLKQEQDGYEFCQGQMAECDRRLDQYLQQQKDRSQGASLPEEKRKRSGRSGKVKKKTFFRGWTFSTSAAHFIE
jgi:hypothetical protein